MRATCRGFTVIELLIVIALLAIVAAIAYPRYEAYTIRSKVSDVLKLADKDSKRLADYYAKKGSMPKDAAAAKKAGIDLAGASASPYLAGHGKYRDAPGKNSGKHRIALIYTLTDIDPSVNHKTMRLTGAIQAGQVQWHCTSAQIESDYLPSHCKSTVQ